MATTSRRARSPEAIAKQKATLARKKRAKLRAQAKEPIVLLDHNEEKARRAGKRGDDIALANGKNARNPHEIVVAGLRDYLAFEVKRLLPEVVAAEMSKRFGGGS